MTPAWELDLSELHDLAHRPLSRRCRDLPGGVGRHLRLWCAYVAWPGIRERTLCHLGRHRWATWTRYDRTGGVTDGEVTERFRACEDCGRRAPEEVTP